MPGKHKFFLECPFSEKDTVKSLGAKWDASIKKWFVPDALDTDLFKEWWPVASNRPMAAAQILQIERLYLDCDFHEKDEVKRLGAKWDKGNRRWYIPDGIDAEKFIQWLPNTEAEAEERADVLQVEIDDLEERVETLEKETEEYELEDLVQKRVSAIEALIMASILRSISSISCCVFLICDANWLSFAVMVFAYSVGSVFNCE